MRTAIFIFDDFVSNLKSILDCFSKAGLKLNPGKSPFGFSEMIFLAFTVTSERMQHEKRVCSNFLFTPKKPESLKMIRHFVAFFSLFWIFYTKT